MQDESNQHGCGRGRSTAIGAVVLGWSLVISVACTGPISTMRSPFHLRTVEVRNATDRPRILKIEPAASQHAGTATTFTGVLRPGETKALYLYHGLEYDFRILEPPGFRPLTMRTMPVTTDIGLVFAGDSLLPQGDRIQPHTTRGRAVPSTARALP